MLFDKAHPWQYAIGVWGAFLVATVLYLLFNFGVFNITLVLGLLTAAIIVTIGKAIYVLYTKRK